MERKESMLPLDELSLGGEGRVVMLCAEGLMRRRMRDLGLIDETIVRPVHRSPAGDPTAYLIRGAVIALRQQDAHQVWVECIRAAP